MQIQNRVKNILLINSFWSPQNVIEDYLAGDKDDSTIFFTLPLGIMTIGAWCRQDIPEANLEIIDVMLELHKIKNATDGETIDFDTFVNNILSNVKNTPDFIGVSLSSSSGHNPSMKLIKKLKEKWPDTTIIVGGMHATVFAHRVITEPGIDYMIRGVGDKVFPQLIQALLNGEDVSNVDGCVRELSEIGKFSSRLEDLDSIPPLPFDLIDMDYLVTHDGTAANVTGYDGGARTGRIMMSRGCPFPCTFCAASHIHGQKVFFKSVDVLIDEIRYLIDTFKVDHICIIDDLFGADKKHFYEFFERIKEEKLNVKILIPAGLSLNLFDKHMIDILIENGMDSIFFPLESGSEYVQKNVIQKRVDLKKAKELIEYTKSRGVYTSVNIVMGTPGETLEMMLESFEFLKNLSVDWINIFLAFPYPGTAMTNTLLSRGDLTENELMNVWDNKTQSYTSLHSNKLATITTNIGDTFRGRSFDTIEMKGDELMDLVYDFIIKLNFFENSNIKEHKFDRMMPELNRTIKSFSFHIVALCCRARCYYETGKKELAMKDIEEIKAQIIKNENAKNMFDNYGTYIEGMLDFYKGSLVSCLGVPRSQALKRRVNAL